MSETLPALFTEHKDPALLLDEYHPANQDYMRNLEDIKRLIVAQSAPMNPRTVEVVKSRLLGASNKEVGAKLKMTTASVTRHFNKPDAQVLAASLRHLTMAIEGPMTMQRRAMLWEVALDAKDSSDYKVIIAAIAELNKMDGTYDTEKATGDINITINNELYPRGELDQ